MNREAKEARIAKMLAHYFKTVWEQAGLRWEGDNYAEIDEIVALLMDYSEGVAGMEVEKHGALYHAKEEDE